MRDLCSKFALSIIEPGLAAERLMLVQLLSGGSLAVDQFETEALEVVCTAGGRYRPNEQAEATF